MSFIFDRQVEENDAYLEYLDYENFYRHMRAPRRKSAYTEELEDDDIDYEYDEYENQNFFLNERKIVYSNLNKIRYLDK